MLTMFPGFKGLLYGLFHMPCLFHLLTGLYCPGCGGTRAVRYLLQGHIVQSFIYHPLVPYMALVLVAEVITALAARVIGRKSWYLGHETRFVYIGAAIVLVNWAVKNVLLVGYGIDLLTLPLR